MPSGPFAADLAFLQQHTTVVVLTGPTGAQVVVSPTYQGRVMTSTTGGVDAPSFGWLGRETIGSRQYQPHMNVFGGEDRFWLGPEGGQYGLYFKPGDPFDLPHWQTPAPFDWDPWDIAEQATDRVRFRKRMSLINYAKTAFELDVDRTVRLLTAVDAAAALGGTVPETVRLVAFASANTVTNAGAQAWTARSGLLSIWILGQFLPTPATTVAIPFHAGDAKALGPVVNDAYFGRVPADRLVTKDDAILFKADGQYRAKIGLSPVRTSGVAGSYDADRHVLTIVQFTRPAGARDYVNSMWEIQQEPYRGDALNSYNDGPPGPGQKPLGPFYELESSSPALALEPGQTYTHVHRTFHLTGADAELDRIARDVLKVGLQDITGAFTPK
ncbi:MAG: DUF6786 family protein [Vicinamibacterales bacterium]